MEQMDTLKHISGTLNIHKIHTTTAPPTPPNTKVNRIRKWSSLRNKPSEVQHPFYNPPPLPTYQHKHSHKFNPIHSYYTDGSFKPPTQDSTCNWIREEAGYGIYNPGEDLNINKRLLGL